MTSLRSEVEVLKQDERGRVRVPRERRESLLDEFEASGTSGARFARLAGIKYSTFAAWVQRRRKARAAQSTDGDAGMHGLVAPGGVVRWFEAVRDDEAKQAKSGVPAAGLRIELPGGSRMVVESPLQLGLAAELVAQIAQSLRARC